MSFYGAWGIFSFYGVQSPCFGFRAKFSWKFFMVLIIMASSKINPFVIELAIYSYCFSFVSAIHKCLVHFLSKFGFAIPQFFQNFLKVHNEILSHSVIENFP